MPLLQEVAEKLSNNHLERGVVEEIIDRESLFAALPFTEVSNKAYVYNREDEANVSGVEFLGVNATIPEKAYSVTTHTEVLKIMAGDVDVDKFLDRTMSDHNAQKAQQLAMKAKYMGRLLKNKIITGDAATNPLEFNGLSKVCEAEGREKIVGANGAPITLEMLDELLDEIKRGADAIMMRPGTLRALKVLWRDFGGNTGQMVQLNNFGMVPAHDGTPIIVNEFIPDNVVQGTAPNTTSIYVMRLNEFDGFHGLLGSQGIQVEDIGTVQDKDATRTRIKMYMGTCLKSKDSVFALRGITNV